MRKILVLLFVCYAMASLAIVAQAEHVRPIRLAVFVMVSIFLLITGLAVMALEAHYLSSESGGRPFPALRHLAQRVQFALSHSMGLLGQGTTHQRLLKSSWQRVLPSLLRGGRRRAVTQLGQFFLGVTVVGKRPPAAPSRLGTHVTVLILVVIVASSARLNWLPIVYELHRGDIAKAVSEHFTATPRAAQAGGRLRSLLAKVDEPVSRQAQPLTQIPSRPREKIITYTVQPGDTLFGVAFQFGLAPETILWANSDLKDEPDSMHVGMVLNVLPVDGVAHIVQNGDTVQSLAALYQSSAEAIMTAEWNSIRPGQQPEVGQQLIIPGGKRELAAWQLPFMPAVINPRITQAYSGFCEEVIFLPLASGTFIWPTDNHRLTGNPYTWWHRGLDLAGKTGGPVYASDGGTVIYAGWNPWGYGKLVVVEHGDGWQSWYAHLSKVNVHCGQHFYQGTLIGAIGSTGRSTGSHLHFEIRHNNNLINPLTILE